MANQDDWKDVPDSVVFGNSAQSQATNSIIAPVAQAYQQSQQQQVPQMPVTPGYGSGMNTIQSMQANSLLDNDAAKAKIAANIANMAKANAIPVEVAQKSALIGPSVQQTAQEEQAKNIVGAQTSVARDSANVNMFAGVGRQLMDYYDEAYKNNLAGDKYRAAAGQALVSGAIPRGVGLDKLIDSSAPVGAFNAAGNEWMTRMTPVMQEQFGKEGGSRILESMLKMAAKETPGLNQPRTVVQAQLGATYKNLLRFTFGTADYKSRLGDVDINTKTPQNSVDDVAKKLWNMSSVSLKPDVERKINDTVAYMTKDSNYQFAKNPQTGEIAVKGNKDKSWRILGQ